MIEKFNEQHLLVKVFEFIYERPFWEIMQILKSTNVIFYTFSSPEISEKPLFLIESNQMCFDVEKQRYIFYLGFLNSKEKERLVGSLMAYQWLHGEPCIFGTPKGWFTLEYLNSCIEFIIKRKLNVLYKKAYNVANERGIEIGRLLQICDEEDNMEAKIVFLHQNNLCGYGNQSLRL